MLKKKTTILFDVDGTLFDSIPTILESFREMFKKLKEKYPGDEAIKSFLGSDLDNTLKGFIPKEKIPLAKQTYRKIYLTKQDAGIVPLFPDTVEVLEYLKENHYQLGIVTTKTRQSASVLFEDHNISHFFEIMIGAEDVTNRKPHPDPLLKAAKDLNVDVRNTVYIGDAIMDKQASNKAGMDFIAVTTGSVSKEAFQKAGQKIILPELINLKEFF